MHTGVSYTAAVCFDAALFYLLGCGAAPLLPVFGSNDVAGLLAFLWSAAAIRWGLICSLWLPAVDQTSRPVMRRWAAVHCFLGSVYESGRLAAFGGPLETGIGPLGSPGFTFLTSIAAAAACMFWEVAFPDTNGEDNGKGKQQKARVLFMRVISFCQPDYLILLGAYVFLFLAVLFELFALLQTGKLIDSLGVEHQRHKFPSVLLSMALFSFGSVTCLPVACAALVAPKSCPFAGGGSPVRAFPLRSFSSLFTAAREGFFSCAISSFSCRIKLKLFHSLVRQEIGFFDSTKTGDICSRLSTDTSLTGRAVSLSINLLLRSLIEFLGIAFVMLSLSWKLTLLVLMEMPLNSLLQSVYNIYFQRYSKRVHDFLARANDVVGEAAAGIRTVRSFRAEHVEARRYGDRLMDVHKLRIRREAVRAVHALMRKVTDQGLWLAMLYSGIKLIESGHMSTGTLVFFMFYQRDLGNRIKTLIYIFGDVLNSVSVAEKVFEYLDRKPQVSTDGTLQPDTLRGHVQLCNLTFSYPTRPELPVLQGLSLELKPGQVTALVGPSGGGKTTCVSLLEGFYQPQGGEILLDGQPLHSYQHKYLHSKVAMVGQDPVLFSGSVRENITYGLKDCPLEAVQEAARRANAHGFISQLEHGYDTDVGERGGQLSGGQKQRIAIARALIREPQVLILDEVTSCLDAESEHAVLQALASHPTQSILIIAHRLKTVQRADQIFLIDHGVVVERGTHLELMGKNGKYYRLQEKVFMEESPG